MFAPPPEARAPRTSTRDKAPQVAASDLPSQAFAPPPEDPEGEDDEIAVERSTRAIRIAREFERAQAAAPAAAASSPRLASPPRAAPPSSRRGLVLGVALIAAVVLAILAIVAR